MSFAGGEWTLLAIGLLLFFGGGTAVWIGRKKTDGLGDGFETTKMLGTLALVVGVFLLIAAPWASHSRADTLHAKHDLQHQGFRVVAVDLSQTYGQATLHGPGGCVVRRDVQQHGGVYRVVWNGHPGDPAKLNCDGS